MKSDAELLKSASAHYPPAGSHATYPREEMIQACAREDALKQAMAASPLVRAAVDGLRRALDHANRRIDTLNGLLEAIRLLVKDED